MDERWARVLSEAQDLRSYTIEGRAHPRVPYGRERGRFERSIPCHDCEARRGQYHVPRCDMEQCPVCGGQLLSCDCSRPEEWDSDWVF
jgi:hypothetical protein